MRVLVVGAGIAGLSTARALREVGIGCDVVERERAWPGEGTGIYLPANATRALRLLGLGTLAASHGVVVPRQRFLDHRGRLLLDIALATVWGGDDPCIAMPRTALHEVLLGDLADSIRMGTTVTALRALEDRVAVSFDDGSMQGYDLVVGADGIHSELRKRMLEGSDGDVVRPVGQMAWRFVTACPAQVTTWSVMLGHGSTFLTIPIGADQVYCYADVAVDRAENADLASVFTAYAEPVGEILASLDGVPVHRGPIEEVVLPNWVVGRVLLIGDAAHATSPNMAQGAAMALEDALVLADCLTEASNLDLALARFQHRRRARTDWVRAQTHRRDETRNLPPLIRNAALRIAGQRIFRRNYAPLTLRP